MLKQAVRVTEAAVLCFVIGVPAYATPIFTLGNAPQPGEENVLYGANDAGNTIIGHTNQSNTAVSFSSTDTLITTAQGQSNLTALSGIHDVGISVPGGAYTDLIINPFNGGSPAGQATVSVQANDGAFPFNYAVGNGNNFLTIVAGAGETILSTTISSTNGFADPRQPRISGISFGEGEGGGGGGLPQAPTLGGFTAVVPEPSTVVLMLTGLGGLIARSLRHRPSEP